MSEKTIFEIAEGFGMTIETVHLPENKRAYRIYRGAHQVFIGTEEAVRLFLIDYDNSRPELYMGSMYGYRE